MRKLKTKKKETVNDRVSIIVDDLIRYVDANNIDVSEISKNGNIHRSTIYRVLNKKSKPRLETLILICNEIGYEINI